MMRERCHGNFTGDIHFWQVYKAISSEACLFLYYVFCWGCQKDPSMTLKEYLMDVKGMSREDYKYRFDKMMRAKILENASGDDFDVSLLYAAIKTTCEGLADEKSDIWTTQDDTKLESICTELKNMRGYLVHEGKVSGESERDDLLNKIEDLLCKGYNIAGKLYQQDPTDIDEYIQNMKNCIGDIRKSQVMPMNVEQYKQEIIQLRKYRKDVISEEICEMRKCAIDIESVDPASWFHGSVGLKLKSVFTHVDVVRETLDQSNPETINYENMLVLETEGGRQPSIIVLEGEAGAGKTTLSRLLLTEWAECKDAPPNFQSLEQYELVLHFECRNVHISKFEDLILVFLRKSSYHLKTADILSAVLELKVLVIADGLDEGNTKSELLLKDIISNTIPHSKERLRLVLTTRPERIPKVSALCQDACWVHLRIKGIAFHKRSEFVHRLHSELINKKLSKQDTQGLIDFLKQSQIRIGEHFRLPLILTFLTYLWAYDPACINAVTTATRLYISFHDMVLGRLLDRLLRHSSNTRTDLKEKCQKFLEVLYEISSVTLSSGVMKLSDECCNKINEICRSVDIPSEEICAAFLSLDRKWTARGYEMSLVAPHKSILEFYVAQYIFQRMYLQDDDAEFNSELKALCRKFNKTLAEIENLLDASRKQRKKNLCDFAKEVFDIGKPDCYLSDFKNVFIHFGGIVAVNPKHSLTDIASEFIKLLQEARVHGPFWLDVVAEAECNDEVTRLAAENIDLYLIVRDGHTIAAQKVMQYLDERIPVRVILECEALHIPHLEVMLSKIAERNCDVELFLNHQWRDSDFGYSDNLLGVLTNKKCRLSQFTGNLRSLKLLPDTIKKLRCTIPDSKVAKEVCRDLLLLHDRLELEYLGVHVLACVQPESLGNLPVCNRVSKECATIWLSKISDREVEWACRVARALLPHGCKYNNICFPRSNLSTAKCRELVSSLHSVGVQVRKRGAIKVSSETISHKEEVELRFFTRDLLSCEFHNVVESDIW